jgi:hypothetical protein
MAGPFRVPPAARVVCGLSNVVAVFCWPPPGITGVKFTKVKIVLKS